MQKISNQRKDFHFKLANKICSEYALICIEDLNIKGMQKRWGRKISDYGFSEFIKILELFPIITIYGFDGFFKDN